MELPKDAVILLSYVNTQLRDYYESLEELCKSLTIEEEWLRNVLDGIDYHYCADQNRFL